MSAHEPGRRVDDLAAIREQLDKVNVTVRNLTLMVDRLTRNTKAQREALEKLLGDDLK